MIDVHQSTNANSFAASSTWAYCSHGVSFDPSAGAEDRVLEKITVNIIAPDDAGQHLAFSGLVAPKMAGLEGFEYRLRNDTGWSNPFLLTLARSPVVLDNGAN